VKVWFTILLIATIGARGRFVGSNPAYTTFELKHLFTVTKTKFLVIDPDQFDKAKPAAEACGIRDANIFIFNTSGESRVGGFKSWRTLLDLGESDWYRFNNEQEAKGTPAILALTSGTTGPPKAAMLSHHTFVALSKQTHDSQDKPYKVGLTLANAAVSDPA
jgi:long-subunit acyl-CoA synthetase (AMP-forming)